MKFDQPWNKPSAWCRKYIQGVELQTNDTCSSHKLCNRVYVQKVDWNWQKWSSLTVTAALRMVSDERQGSEPLMIVSKNYMSYCIDSRYQVLLKRTVYSCHLFVFRHFGSASRFCSWLEARTVLEVLVHCRYSSATGIMFSTLPTISVFYSLRQGLFNV